MRVLEHQKEDIYFENETISHQGLSLLINKEISVYVVKNFYDSNLCDEYAFKLKEGLMFSHYSHEEINHETGELEYHYYGVDKYGFPFNNTYNDPTGDLTRMYYNEARKTIKRLRFLSPSGLTPIDKLRLELDEVFERGATIGSFQNKKMLAGVIRVMKEELSHLSEVNPHFDWLPSEVKKFSNQLEANIYIETPQIGGDLELWSQIPLEESFVPPENWRDSLGLNFTSYRPQKGDLVLFSTRNPHAIRKFSGGNRINMQSFIGFNSNEPLQIWN